MKMLIMDGDLATVKEMRDSGEWTDLETAVDSGKGNDGTTWYFTAMVMAAQYKQLEVMRWLIEKGAKVNETRERHVLPSNMAARGTTQCWRWLPCASSWR